MREKKNPNQFFLFKAERCYCYFLIMNFDQMMNFDLEVGCILHE